MAKFYYTKDDKSVPITAAELSMLLRGSSLLKAVPERPYDFKTGENLDERLTLKTSDNLYPQIYSLKGEVIVEILSTVEHEIRIELIPEMYESPSALVLERCLRALRQLYALVLILDLDYTESLEDFTLPDGSDIDLEALVIAEKDHLRIASASVGSFWLTLARTTAKGTKAALTLASLFYNEGRNALLRRLEAETRSAELDAAKKESDLRFSEADKTIDLINKVEKIKDPHTRRRVKANLVSSLREIRPALK